MAKGNVEMIHLSDAALCPLGCLLRWLGRVPVAVSVHGLDVIYPSLIYQTMMRRCLPCMDRVICNSQHTQTECIRCGAPAAHCPVVSPGVDSGMQLGMPDPERQSRASRWGVEVAVAGRHVMLTAGRLVPRKGVARFVAEALPQLRRKRNDWVYLVAGEGPERARIEGAIGRHGLSEHVELLGAISDADLWAAYILADVFVMPNVPMAGNPEGFGMVVLEARAAGTPVVAADIEGIREAAGGAEDSTLVQPADWPALLAAIENRLDRDEGAEAREQRRQRVLAQFAWPHVAARYLAVFRDMMGEFNQHRGKEVAHRG